MHALAAAVVLCAGLAQHGAAQALTLGRLEVQSALGEPLRAVIQLPQITAEEAASLRVGLASPDIYRAAGMPVNPALSQLQIRVERRTDGSAVLVLSTPSSLNEPFIELIVEAQWAAGRMLRDYSLSLDTSKAGASASVAPLLPAAPSPVRPEPARAAPERTPEPPVRESTDAAADRATPKTPDSRQTNAVADTSPTQKIRVQYGDTASKIAAQHRPAEVSLDQMLVALLRGNPAAFVDGNVNRMKAGALIEIPSSPEAQALAPAEARRIIVAQSRDFNEFRRRLAGEARLAATDTNERQSSGQVQGEVKEERSTDTPADKLMLSKGSVAAKGAEEDRIAQERQAQDTAVQVAELSRNIEELAKLSAAAPGSAPASPSADAPAAQEPPAAAPPAGPALSTTLPSTASAGQAPSDPDSVSSLITALSKEPLVMPLAGGLLAVLAGLGFLVSRRRQQLSNGHPDSAFLNSRQEPAALFEADNAARMAAASAAVTPAESLLDSQDVDPLAEADVYLAYGRDMQAEEILREALPGSPQRLAIIQKLLDIYARRRDTQGFEALALDARELTQGQGPQWAQICDMGMSIDAGNPLYQPGGLVGEQASAATNASTGLDLDLHAGASHDKAQASPDAVDFDFSFPPEMAARIAAASQPQHRPPAPSPIADEEPGAEDGLEDASATAPSRPGQGAPLAPGVDWSALNLDIGLPTTEEPRRPEAGTTPVDKPS